MVTITPIITDMVIITVTIIMALTTGITDTDITIILITARLIHILHLLRHHTSVVTGT